MHGIFIACRESPLTNLSNSGSDTHQNSVPRAFHPVTGTAQGERNSSRKFIAANMPV